MPDISMPEVRLRDKLPEGLRDMTMDDIQRALPDVRMPRLDIGREARNAGKAAERASRKAEKAAAKAAATAAKQADKAARGAHKAASREAGKAVRVIENALPRKRGPNPVPIAILFMLGGLVVGWILATSPTAAPRISAWLDDLRGRWDEWRRRGELQDEEWEAVEPHAYTEPLSAASASGSDGGTMAGADSGLATGTSELPDAMGAGDPARVGADDQI
jgi:hypothetical protein